MMAYICGSRDAFGQQREIRESAHGVQVAVATQMISKSHDIDRFVPVVKLYNARYMRLGLLVEIFRLKAHLQHSRQGLIVEDDGSEHGLFGLDIWGGSSVV
jgi:hypothetical protein